MDRHHICKIEASSAVHSSYWRLRFASPLIAREARAGQFVHVLPSAAPSTLQPSFAPLLRRAFSILSVHNESVEILFRVGGLGTQMLAQLKPGDRLDVLGPLGKAFPTAEGQVILVGGGVGVPPLSMLASQAANDAVAVQAIIGGRSRADILCVEDFRARGVEPIIMTDDGSLGSRGLVTEPLEKMLSSGAGNDGGANSSIDNVANLGKFHVKQTVYACGPLPMLAAVAALCETANVPCIVSLEENMPCGIGVCNGCVVPAAQSARGNRGNYEDYRRVCIDGPGMWAHEIDWAALCG